MKHKTLPTPEDRLEKIQADLTAIKQLLEQLVSVSGREQPEPEEAILSVKQVATYLGIEPAAVYAKCAKGELPYYKLGKLYKFKKAEVIKWMEKPKVPGNIDVEDYVNRYLQKNVLRG